MEYQVEKRNGEVLRFVTDLSVAEAYDVISKKQYKSGFESSLVSRPAHKLSEKQQLWLLKIAQDTVNPPAEEAGPYRGIISALVTMQENAKGRAILRLPGVTVKFVSRGRNTGCAYVYNDAGDYAGAITPMGNIRSNELFTNQLDTALCLANADPVAAAKEYGKMTGRCSVCGRGLTDPTSVEQGIGPICLSRLGG